MAANHFEQHGMENLKNILRELRKENKKYRLSFENIIDNALKEINEHLPGLAEGLEGINSLKIIQKEGTNFNIDWTANSLNFTCTINTELDFKSIHHPKNENIEKMFDVQSSGTKEIIQTWLEIFFRMKSAENNNPKAQHHILFLDEPLQNAHPQLISDFLKQFQMYLDEKEKSWTVIVATHRIEFITYGWEDNKRILSTSIDEGLNASKVILKEYEEARLYELLYENGYLNFLNRYPYFLLDKGKFFTFVDGKHDKKSLEIAVRLLSKKGTDYSWLQFEDSKSIKKNFGGLVHFYELGYKNFIILMDNDDIALKQEKDREERKIFLENLSKEKSIVVNYNSKDAKLRMYSFNDIRESWVNKKRAIIDYGKNIGDKGCLFNYLGKKTLFLMDCENQDKSLRNNLIYQILPLEYKETHSSSSCPKNEKKKQQRELEDLLLEEAKGEDIGKVLSRFRALFDYIENIYKSLSEIATK